jgi:hypothetical protein
MKRFLLVLLILCSATQSLAQPTENFKTLNESELAAYLLSLQPQQNTNSTTKMLVLAPYLSPGTGARLVRKPRLFKL